MPKNQAEKAELLSFGHVLLSKSEMPEHQGGVLAPTTKCLVNGAHAVCIARCMPRQRQQLSISSKVGDRASVEGALPPRQVPVGDVQLLG